MSAGPSMWALRAARFLPWTALFSILVVGASAKLLVEGDETPLIIQAYDPSGLWFRGITAVTELIIAALLWAERRRHVGGVSAAILWLAYAVGVSITADDPRFLTNCPCFGGMSVYGATSKYVLLWRLGALSCCTYYLLIQLRLLRFAGVFMCAMLAALTIAASRIGDASVDAVGAELRRAAIFLEGPRQGDVSAGVAVVRCSDGRRSDLSEIVRSFDPSAIVFVSASCPACRSLAYRCRERAGMRGGNADARFVVVGIDPPSTMVRFASESGLPQERVFAAASLEALSAIGVFGVPYVLPCARRTIQDPRRRSSTLNAILGDGISTPDKYARLVDSMMRITGADSIDDLRVGVDCLNARCRRRGVSVQAVWVVARDRAQLTGEIVFLFDDSNRVTDIVPLYLEWPQLWGESDKLAPFALRGIPMEEALRAAEDWAAASPIQIGFRTLLEALRQARRELRSV